MPSRRWSWTPSSKRPQGSQVCNPLGAELTKMQYKDKLKKREKDDFSQQAAGANRAASDKAKKSKRIENDDSLPAEVVASKAALDVAQKDRNEVQE